MSTVAEIEAAISQLPLEQATKVSEWLEQWLEDQRELSPEFIASIERGKADIAAGRVRVVRP
jgi:hypothetical protein